MTAVVMRGDARQLPLPDESVDLIVTSPPYFGLRSYTDNGEHYDGQIGSEGTPQEYLEALWACTAEWVRVLKPGGSMFINLGDKYSTTFHSYNYRDPGTYTRKTPQPDGEWSKTGWKGQPNLQPAPQDPGMPPKCLMGIPWRYAIGCTDRLGLILRAEIIWAKPNGLPESVTDRVRRAHEQVFHFTRQPRYYAAVDEIREPQMYPGDVGRDSRGPKLIAMPDGHHDRPAVRAMHPLGKLPGSVWNIPSAPLQVPARLGVDHFAAFPPALVRPLILGWSPPGICTACAEGRRPVSTSAIVPDKRHNGTGRQFNPASGNIGLLGRERVYGITGYACGCGMAGRDSNPQSPIPGRSVMHHLVAHTAPDANSATGHPSDEDNLPPTRPAVVLDPFGGTGTTSLVASTHGRIGVTVDRSADYCRLAAWRVRDPGERARARDMPKPPPVPEGMEPLFAMEGLW